jgi:hypothetical protein
LTQPGLEPTNDHPLTYANIKQPMWLKRELENKTYTTVMNANEGEVSITMLWYTFVKPLGVNTVANCLVYIYVLLIIKAFHIIFNTIVGLVHDQLHIDNI